MRGEDGIYIPVERSELEGGLSLTWRESQSPVRAVTDQDNLYGPVSRLYHRYYN